MAAPISPASSRALVVSACAVVALFCSGCGGVSQGVRYRPRASFPRTTVVGSDGETATVIPGGEFAASRLRQLFIGEHYRDLWATPIEVPVLDLATFAGGLTPMRQGGRGQTRTLRLLGRDGRVFVFRTVAKDQRDIIPALLRKTVIAEIVQDQVSSMNPAGALVVDELAHALGVFHAHPVLVLAPDDERLGTFRHAFAGRLGLLEEYPVAGGVGLSGIAGVDKVVSTKKLLKRLKKSSRDRVESRAYLKARLLDMLVGDWDRHDGQWRWARSREHGRDVYYALPRDRDQAFARLDGFFPRIAAVFSVQMENFTADLDDIPDLMHSGRTIDRRVLTDLDMPAWDAVAASVVAALTDEVIDIAVRRLPPPFYELRGPWLAAALKSRRDRLREAAQDFYRTLSASVDVHLSDEPEHLVVQCLDDRSVAVTAYRRDSSSGGLKGGAVYARTYSADETDEVRIHLHGGDDTAVVSGSGRPGLKVRIVGGSGADEFLDGSSAPAARGGSITFLPRPRSASADGDPFVAD